MGGGGARRVRETRDRPELPALAHRPAVLGGYNNGTYRVVSVQSNTNLHETMVRDDGRCPKWTDLYVYPHIRGR